MQTSEGKFGRAFVLRLEKGDEPGSSIEGFAKENGIQAALVFVMAGAAPSGMLATGPDGAPRLRFPGAGRSPWENWPGEGEAVIQEMLGPGFRRVTDPVSGRETLARSPSSRTRVMEKPFPAPEESGPGSIPVYLFNAELN